MTALFLNLSTASHQPWFVTLAGQSAMSTLTYQSWFASTQLGLQAGSCAHVQNGGAPLVPPRYWPLDLAEHVTKNVSRFGFRAHTRVVESNPLWRGGKDIVTNALALLCKMRCMVFSTINNRLSALSETDTHPYFFIFARLFLLRLHTLCMPYQIRLSLMPYQIRVPLIAFVSGTIKLATLL